MKKKIVFIPAYLLLSLVFIFVSIEVSVRLLGIAPSLPSKFEETPGGSLLPWNYPANSHKSGWSDKNEFFYDYRHNTMGFRDTEHSFEKPPGVFRIVSLGDSFTYGIGAKFSETYLYQLEKMLNSREGDHPRVEIIKLGIERYWPEPERIVLEQIGVKYDPDLITVGFVPNDVYDTEIGLKGITVSDGYLVHHTANRLGGKLLARLSVYSHLTRLLLRIYASGNDDKKLQMKPVDDPVYEKDWRIIKSEFAKMAEFAKAAGARFALISIPQWSRENLVREKLYGSCGEPDCVFVDVLPEFLKVKDLSSLYYRHDGHCTPKGYKLIARKTFKQLIESKLVP